MKWIPAKCSRPTKLIVFICLFQEVVFESTEPNRTQHADIPANTRYQSKNLLFSGNYHILCGVVHSFTLDYYRHRLTTAALTTDLFKFKKKYYNLILHLPCNFSWTFIYDLMCSWIFLFWNCGGSWPNLYTNFCLAAVSHGNSDGTAPTWWLYYYLYILMILHCTIEIEREQKLRMENTQLRFDTHISFFF